MVKLMAGIMAFAIASTAIAGDVQKNVAKIPSVKAGKCSITLLGADGIKPLAGAKLTLQSADNAKKIISAEANQAGLCVVDMENGRYVLSVDDKVLTLVDVADNGQLAWCRIVVSEKPMLIGGQDDEEEDNKKGFVFLGLTGSAAVVAAVGAGAVGAAAIVVGGDYADAWDIDGIDDSNDDDDDDTPPPPPPVDNERPPSASR